MKICFIRSLGTTVLLASAFFFANPQLQAQFMNPAPPPSSALSIPQANVMQPEELLPLLKATGAQKPLMLQVGSHMLFAQAHIPGSEYAGPGSQPAGIQMLEDRVKALPRKKLIVLYCGCCPWVRCPNLGPAFEKLRMMGFTNVKALYLADNFGADWASKGYPVEQGR
jgi:thiosulfate/3-mercaptopyruvate sulfurtransferase